MNLRKPLRDAAGIDSDCRAAKPPFRIDMMELTTSAAKSINLYFKHLVCASRRNVYSLIEIGIIFTILAVSLKCISAETYLSTA